MKNYFFGGFFLINMMAAAFSCEAVAASRLSRSLSDTGSVVRASDICRKEAIPSMAAITQAMAVYDLALREKGAGIDAFILTEERKAKVRELFNLAKNAHLEYLKKAAGPDPSPFWAQVLDIVSKVRLRLELRPSQGAAAEFGARLLKLDTESAAEVLVPGISLVTDQAPDVLLFILLHEISHAVDPGTFPVAITGQSDSVFAAPVRCLRLPESVGARTGDPICFARSAEKREKMHLKEAAAFCQRMSEGLKSNPDYSLSGLGCGCEEPQGTEAFADWLATEALVSLGAGRANMESALGWICGAYLEEAKRDEELMQTPGGKAALESMRLMDTHPALSDRIERIILGHPAILKNLFPGKMAAARYCSMLP